MEIEDDPRSGHPVSKIIGENIEFVRTIIDEDPHSPYDDIEAETSLSHGDNISDYPRIPEEEKNYITLGPP